MNKTIRINTNINSDEKYVKLNLEQDFDFIEILSLKISQENVYSQFSSDYGCLVGRVTTNNGGLGIPNARVSIFIPITEDDKEDPVKFSLYPYETINDKSDNGLRYNLLRNKISKFNECHQPVGTFKDKLEVLDNDTELEIYDKYYKFTTTTNNSGDYIIFGVPVGNHVAHMDVDLSDIGDYSQSPYDFINQGYNLDQFESYTKFKKSNDLDLLPQIKSSRLGVQILPFWSGVEGEESGISRADFPISYTITPSALFIGGVFGDNEKNSVNKNCRPRKKLGNLCDTTTGEGTIDMIRKKTDSGVELFSIKGNRLIDEDGTWNYFIPMNRDYMVTNEFGQLVPTEDTTKGIPTTASMRFKIGMDLGGGGGRLRSLAKHLVPNNPRRGDVNYIFDETSPDTQFADFKMGGVYTVRNFIQRFQTSCSGLNCASLRTFTGIKDVDDCPGSKTPFPFNRLDVDLNPLYFILCLILTIITQIIVIINFILIPIINFIIGIVNFIISVVNTITGAFCFLARLRIPVIRVRPFGFLGFFCKLKIDKINPVACITLECDSVRWAPGCTSKKAKDATGDKVGFFHFPDDGDAGHGFFDELPPGSGGFLNCISIVLAEALNVFKFDFYNDWVNGSLYQFLFKYKTRSNGRTKYCAYDCDEFENPVDSNDDGEADVDCDTNYLVDTCVARESFFVSTQVESPDSLISGQVTGYFSPDASKFSNSKDSNSYNKVTIKDGLIKNVDGELYYAAETHNTGNMLFSTDITYLGQINECNVYDEPKIHPSLINTTYLRPPNIADNRTPFDTPVDPLLFYVNCLGVFTDEEKANHCSNIKKICEIGRDLPEDPFNVVDSSTIESSGAFLRRNIVNLNTDTNTLSEYRDFKFFGLGGDDPLGIGRGLPQNNSLYFYFGTKPGKSALDKAKNTFLAQCLIEDEKLMDIIGVITNETENGFDGEIDLTVIGGEAPYEYNWVGPNGYTNTLEDIDNLEAGDYTVTVTDSVGYSQSQTFTVLGPKPLIYFLSRVNVTNNGGNDGSIIINSTQNGVSPYTASIISGPVLVGPSTYPGPDFTFTNLPEGDYVVRVTDSLGNFLDKSITISQPSALDVIINVNNPPCSSDSFDEPATGGYNITTISGGTAPYEINITGPNGYISTGLTGSELVNGTYNVQVDSTDGQTFNTTFDITIPTPISVSEVVTNAVCPGGNGSINISVNGGTPNYQFSWSGFNGNVNSTTQNLSNVPADAYLLVITDSNGCEFREVYTIEEPEPLEIIILTKTSSFVNVTGNGGTPFSGNKYKFELQYKVPTGINWVNESSPQTSEFADWTVEGIYSYNLFGVPGTYTPSQLEWRIKITDSIPCTDPLITRALTFS